MKLTPNLHSHFSPQKRSQLLRSVRQTDYFRIAVFFRRFASLSFAGLMGSLALTGCAHSPSLQTRSPSAENELSPSAVQSAPLKTLSELDPERVPVREIDVLHDGDSFAQSYLGQPLTPLGDETYQDGLTRYRATLSGGGQPSQFLPETIAVSNSVAGAPEVFATSRDGKYVAVVETRKQRRPTDKVFRDLEEGSALSWLIFPEPNQKSRPRVTDEFKLSFVPHSVDIREVKRSPRYRSFLIIVGGENKGVGHLALLRADDSKLTPVWSGPVSRLLSSDELRQNDPPTDRVGLVQWHPKKDRIAVHLFQQNRVAFFSLNGGTLQPWGAPVETGKDPYVGRFSPKGDFYFAANWNRNLNALTIYDRLPREGSTLALIKLSEGNSPHRLVSTLPTASSPEGIAVSEKGNYVATLSMQESLYSLDGGPVSDPAAQQRMAQATQESAVTLFQWNPSKNGPELKTLDTYRFNGILPEGVSFDPNGRFIFASVYQNSRAQSTTGVLEIIEILPLPQPHFVPVGRFSVPHGSHHVRVR